LPKDEKLLRGSFLIHVKISCWPRKTFNRIVLGSSEKVCPKIRVAEQNFFQKTVKVKKGKKMSMPCIFAGKSVL
jgi:hypothetical protein